MTVERDINLKAAAKMGYSQTEAAEALGVTPSAVSRRAAQLGIRFVTQFDNRTGGRKEQYPEALVVQAIESSRTWSTVALKLGWGESSIHKWRRRHPHRKAYRLGSALVGQPEDATVQTVRTRPTPHNVWPDLTPGTR